MHSSVSLLSLSSTPSHSVSLYHTKCLLGRMQRDGFENFGVEIAARGHLDGRCSRWRPLRGNTGCGGAKWHTQTTSRRVGIRGRGWCVVDPLFLLTRGAWSVAGLRSAAPHCCSHLTLSLVTLLCVAEKSSGPRSIARGSGR